MVRASSVNPTSFPGSLILPPLEQGSGNKVGLNPNSAIKLAVSFIYYVHLLLQELTEHFHPVFRHFFLEKFPDPAVWFERRLSYTRGVATSSIGILMHFDLCLVFRVFVAGLECMLIDNWKFSATCFVFILYV